MKCALTLGRHVGAHSPEIESVAFEDKTQPVVADPSEQQGAPTTVDAAFEANLTELGYGA